MRRAIIGRSSASMHWSLIGEHALVAHRRACIGHADHAVGARCQHWPGYQASRQLREQAGRITRLAVKQAHGMMLLLLPTIPRLVIR